MSKASRQCGNQPDSKSTKTVKGVKGFKGFDSNLQCRGFQYELGKTYTHKGAVVLCDRGFHFCEYPLDIFAYYPPTQRFAEVVGDDVSDETSSDSKRVAKSLTIEAEISLAKLITTGIKFRLSKHDFTNAPDKATGDSGAASATGYSGAASATGYSGAASATGYSGAASATGYRGAASATGDSGAASATGYSGAASATGDRGAASATGDSGAASATGYRGAASATGDRGAASATGYRGAASATGYSGAASATGYRGAASATGDRGAASATGEEGCACALGIEGRSMGSIGCWITLSEWEMRDSSWHRIDVQTKKVDGKKIKADTFYMLQSGKFVEVSE